MPERDTAFSQIVRRKLQRDFIARQNANPVSSQSACQMGEHHALMLQLDTEKSARELFQHRSGYFYAVFLTHSDLLSFNPIKSI